MTKPHNHIPKICTKIKTEIIKKIIIIQIINKKYYRIAMILKY